MSHLLWKKSRSYADTAEFDECKVDAPKFFKLKLVQNEKKLEFILSENNLKPIFGDQGNDFRSFLVRLKIP